MIELVQNHEKDEPTRWPGSAGSVHGAPGSAGMASALE
jgi:hypothetical protein